MGFIFSKVWKNLLKVKDVRMLMLGLDAAGKTSVLYQLKMNELVRTIPTIGFNVESISYKGFNMNLWDVGGQHKIRPLWRHYYENTDCLIFVVDSNDTERIEEAKEELDHLLAAEELKNCSVLVMANKQDLKDSLSPNEIADKLGLTGIKGRKWMVQGTSATTGQGVKEGFDWLATTISK